MSSGLHIIGTNFKATDLENVARVHWGDKSQIAAFLEQARERFGLAEVFFLQTCNRREFYIYKPEAAGPGFQEAFLAAVSRSIGQGLDPDHFYHFRDEKAARHLFKVASSLDSMVLGETEIIKQIKDQSGSCLRHGNMGRRLKSLVDIAVWASKQVRHQTDITKNVVSMASLIYRSVSEHLARRTRKRVVFVGAGHFIAGILPTFDKSTDLELIFVNRSRPTHLAELHGGEALTLDEFLNNPPVFDCLISATSAPTALFDADWLARHGENLLLLDAALPRDIDPGVGDLPGMMYLDLDHMESILAANRAAREAEIPKTKPIFDEGLARLEAKFLEAELSQYSREISAHYRETGERALNYLKKDDFPDLSQEDWEKLRSWTQGLVGKLTTIPILGLKGVAKHMGADAVGAYTSHVAANSDLFKEASTTQSA